MLKINKSIRLRSNKHYLELNKHDFQSNLCKTTRFSIGQRYIKKYLDKMINSLLSKDFLSDKFDNNVYYVNMFFKLTYSLNNVVCTLILVNYD